MRLDWEKLHFKIDKIDTRFTLGLAERISPNVCTTYLVV